MIYDLLFKVRVYNSQSIANQKQLRQQLLGRQQMENQVKIMCINGNQAHLLCVQNDCYHSSPICKVINCGCKSQYHPQCLALIPAQNLLFKLLQKGRNTANETDPIALQYISAIKSLIADFQEYKISKSTNSLLKFFGQEEKLYKFIKNKQSKQITPQLISSVLKSLKSGNKTQNIQIKELDILKGQNLTQYDQLKRAQTYTQHNPSTSPKDQDFRIFKGLFNVNIFTKDQFQIFNEGRTIQRVSQYNNKFYCALVSPALQFDEQPKIVSLKLEKFRYLCIGIAHIKTLSSKAFDWVNSIGGGVYAINNDGYTFNHRHKQQDYKFSKCCFHNGDVVIVKYDPKGQKMTIQNKSRNYQTSLDFITQKGNPLHLCIVMKYPGDTVHLL